MKLNYPIAKAATFLGTKWTIELIYDLREGRKFCELQEIMGGINPNTLSHRLKTLEAEEIISRQVVPDTQRHMDERYAIVGAQPYENFVSALEQIEQEAGVQFQEMH